MIEPTETQPAGAVNLRANEALTEKLGALAQRVIDLETISYRKLLGSASHGPKLTEALHDFVLAHLNVGAQLVEVLALVPLFARREPERLLVEAAKAWAHEDDELDARALDRLRAAVLAVLDLRNGPGP